MYQQQQTARDAVTALEQWQQYEPSPTLSPPVDREGGCEAKKERGEKQRNPNPEDPRLGLKDILGAQHLIIVGPVLKFRRASARVSDDAEQFFAFGCEAISASVPNPLVVDTNALRVIFL